MALSRREMISMMGGGAVYAAQNAPVPVTRQLHTELSPKWIRVRFGGEVIADSRRALIMLGRGTPAYYFPKEDVRMDRLTPTSYRTQNETLGEASWYTVKAGPKVAENAAWSYSTEDLRGYVAFTWEKMDGWYEEGEEVFVHPHDPYHRIDVLLSTRPMKVVVGGMTVAESQRPVILFETNFPARYYLPKDDVRLDLVRPSDTITRCPYKGEARYYSVAIGDKMFKDVIWYYRYPTTEASKIANHLAFYTEQTDATFVDAKELAKPQRGQRG